MSNYYDESASPQILIWTQLYSVVGETKEAEERTVGARGATW